MTDEIEVISCPRCQTDQHIYTVKGYYFSPIVCNICKVLLDISDLEFPFIVDYPEPDEWAEKHDR